MSSEGKSFMATTSKLKWLSISASVIAILFIIFSVISLKTSIDVLGRFQSEESLTDNHQEQADGHQHTHSTENVDSSHFEVLYTETGYIPNNLEVPVGSTVSFKNLTQSDNWVASDPHPVHTDNSSFDAGGDEEIYTFTFDQIGTFGYHNHYKSIHRGSVRVVDHTHGSVGISKTPEGLQPIRDKFINMFDPNDSNTIFTIIEAIQSDQELSLSCHDIAHDLGHKAYELYGFSEAMTFNNPNHVDHPLVQYICAGGYMHGILEALSINEPDFSVNPGKICESMPEVERDSCFHGVGHVFMLANERDVEESLNNCRVLEEDTDMYRCFEGIRMEQFWGNTEHVNGDTLGWDINNPLATCMEAKEDEKPTCFLYAPFGYLRENPKDYFGAVRVCTESAISKSDSSFCLKGLGITMMSKFKGKNLEGSELYVKGLDPELRYSFYQGVLGYAQLSGVSEEELKKTCSLFQTDSELCLSVHKSMEPTFEAYARLAKEQAAGSTNSLYLARQYFSLANSRSLAQIQLLLTNTTTYSSEDGEVYFGVNQIMDMLRSFFGKYSSLNWNISSIKEVRPGVVFVEFNFAGTIVNGEKVEFSGTSYIIVNNDVIQHIEMRFI